MDDGPLLRMTLHGSHCTCGEARTPHLALRGLATVHPVSLPLPRRHLCHFLEGAKLIPAPGPFYALSLPPGVPPPRRSSSAVSGSPVLRARLRKVLS